MRKKRIIRLLQNANNKTVEEIGREYPGLTDTERDRLYSRIERELQAVPEESAAIPEAEKASSAGKFSFWSVFQKTAAAACALVLCGTFAGLFWMKKNMQAPPQPEPAVFSKEEKGRIYSVGERYAAENLTISGTLWLTVTDTEYSGGLYRVTAELESDNAISIAGNDIFMLDNIMVATGQSSDKWIAVQPCYVTRPGQEEKLPYTAALRSGEKQKLTLWYKFREEPAELMLVTSYSSAYSYSVIKEK